MWHYRAACTQRRFFSFSSIPHVFIHIGFDIKQLPQRAFALDPQSTQGAGGVSGEAAGIVE